MLQNDSKLKILIADDDYYNYLFIKILLKNDFITDWAKDGETALDMFAEKQYDLILVDYKMSRLSGADTTRIIRKSNPSIPIIAQTAYDLKQQELLSAGCNCVLIKPIRKNILFDALKSCLPG